MKSSTFNFLVAIFCAVIAVVGNQTAWIVALNVVLSLFNLWVGLTMHKRGL